MTDTKQLKDEELKQVSGGTGENVNGTDGSSTVSITIHSINGKNFNYTVNPEITVYNLKLLYCEYEGYVSYVRFVYKGKELDNSITLASCNITSGADFYSVGKWNK